MNTRILIAAIAFMSAGAFAQAATASENWENHCAKCHGVDGKGQTKIGKKLKLRDYTDPKVQAELKDEDMLKAIANGIQEGGKERMKGFKDELSEKDMNELVGYIRKFKS